jgi:hypothetical protein
MQEPTPCAYYSVPVNANGPDTCKEIALSLETLMGRLGQNGSNSHPKAGLSWPSLPIFGWELEPFWPLLLPITLPPCMHPNAGCVWVGPTGVVRS